MPARPSLFCDLALSERIERAEAEFMAACTIAAHRRTNTGVGFVIDVAGGAATFAEPSSPYNKVAGLGFAGTPTAAEFEQVERAYASCGAAVHVELAHLADPSLGTLLSERGYRLTAFKNVLGLDLRGAPRSLPRPTVDIRPSDDAELDAWLTVVADAAAHPDPQGVPWHEEFPHDIYVAALRDSAAAAVRRYSALRDATLVGGAGLRISGEVAQLTGAATAPQYRRQGVQASLLAARIRDAVAAGCNVAVITTQPASVSQHNAQRQGFDLLYVRTIWEREAGP